MNVSNFSKGYRDDHNLTYSCEYNVVFCSKYTRDSLTLEVQKRLEEIIRECQVEFGFSLLGLTITSNYVHLVVSANPLRGIYETVTRIKNRTSGLIRKEFPSLNSSLPCLWTHHRFISSCGEVSLEEINKYIEEQRGK